MPLAGLKQIVSMVDCFEAMVNTEADRLANRKVLVIGTAFTASQALYPDVLSAALPGIGIHTIAATDLERKIARLEPREDLRNSVLTRDLGRAIQNTDIAVLSCTRFPIVKAELESLFPEVIFLDPGTYCSGILKESAITQDKKLNLKVTGKAVSRSRVIEFVESYLGNASVVS